MNRDEISEHWSADLPAQIEGPDGPLEYACFGPGSHLAPTILMLHEGLGSAALWRDFPEALSRKSGCGVVAYSRYNYGRSALTAFPRRFDYLEHEALVVLPAVIDALGLKQCILFGHSDGGTIAALQIAETQDVKIRGAVIIAPHFFVEDIAVEMIRRARKEFAGSDLQRQLARHHNDENRAFYGWADTWMSEKFRDWDMTRSLQNISVPVLAVQGRSDQYATLSQIDVLVRNVKGPATKLILEDCKHAPHAEQPEKLIEAVVGFIAGLNLACPT
ncbi:MAG: pimeloyl-ACP methyl ester carboxylesterase [Paracoccaceae bacterium]|jgi:pimeloyl-ACP methyl ester carboxylesterase